MADLFDGTAVPLKAQIKELQREVAMRERLYPGWVEAGRMPRRQAERQIAAMRAALETLWACSKAGAPAKEAGDV